MPVPCPALRHGLIMVLTSGLCPRHGGTAMPARG